MKLNKAGMIIDPQEMIIEVATIEIAAEVDMIEIVVVKAVTIEIMVAEVDTIEIVVIEVVTIEAKVMVVVS